MPVYTDKLTVAIDFDGTFAADPIVWRAVAELLKARGHTVIMVTQRTENFRADVAEVVGLDWLRIIFASGKSKEDAALDSGFKVNIWIDDAPFSVATALVYRG
jgi:hypothetical protein